MLGIRTILKSDTNLLHIRIPDAFKNRKLEVIVLPANKDILSEEYEFWNDEEFQQLGKLGLGTSLKDKEDFSK